MRYEWARGPSRRSRWWGLGPALPLLLLVLAGSGCDGLFKSDELPPEVTDPAITRTPQGALVVYNGTVATFRAAYGDNGAAFVPLMGLLSDELHIGGGTPPAEDFRTLPESGILPFGLGSASPVLYSEFQKVRGQAGQAIGLLTDYQPELPALVGHVYALGGYAEVFLAELFCSGIPLSTLDYNGGYTLQPGSTTAAVFTHAAALFDSALALAGDSVLFMDLARVGKGRALLALGQYAAAAAAVSPVPDAFSYTFSYTAAAGANAQHFAVATDGWSYTVADLEGSNGLNYRTSGDPRTQASLAGSSNATWHPDKYARTGAGPIVLASGIEARLIEAEAALQAGDPTTWLSILNHLRQTAWPTIVPAVAGPLPDTTDPGTAAGRVDLLFRERAFWLFLTGHRQGDLRRLIRQYGRRQDEVYPVGPYSSPNATGITLYGSDVTAPIPVAERVSNPKFTGCASRDA